MGLELGNYLNFKKMQKNSRAILAGRAENPIGPARPGGKSNRALSARRKIQYGPIQYGPH